MKRLKRDTSSGKVRQAASGPESTVTVQGVDASKSGSAQVVAAEGRRSGIGRAGIVAALIGVLAAVGFGIYKWMPRGGAGTGFNVQNMQVTRLTENGKAAQLAISPDGRYVAWVVRDGEKESLWVRQVATGSEVQILPPEEIPFVGLSFSPDGNYLYFVRTDKATFNFAYLYKIASLGGSATQIVRDVDTSASVSPDGSRITYVRGAPQEGVWNLLMASADGSGERKLGSFHSLIGAGYVGAPAWSPDGKSIALTLWEFVNGQRPLLKIVSVADGSSKNIYLPEPGSSLGPPVWLPDGSGLLLVVRDATPGARGQIWHIRYPTGEAQRFTNDPTDYSTCCLDLTKDGRTMAVMQDNLSADLWVAEAGRPDDAKQVSSGEAHPAVTWTADGKLLTVGGNGQVDLISADGSGLTRLTLREEARTLPAACGDGRYLVYTARTGATSDVWRVDAADGGNPTQLTKVGSVGYGGGRTKIACAPDGKWVAFLASNPNSNASAWRIPIEGGSPTKLVDDVDRPRLSIAPDGKMVAVHLWGKTPTSPSVLAAIPAEGGEPAHHFDAPPGMFGLRWSPDGKAFQYVLTRGGVSNLWEQPLAGGAPKQLTNFKAEQIVDFEWSLNGKQLALSRGHLSSNVVLISNFH